MNGPYPLSYRTVDHYARRKRLSAIESDLIERLDDAYLECYAEHVTASRTPPMTGPTP